MLSLLFRWRCTGSSRTQRPPWTTRYTGAYITDERQTVSIWKDLGSDTAKKQNQNGFLIVNSVTMLLSSQVLVYLDLQDRKENLAASYLPQVWDKTSHFRWIIARPKNQHDIITYYRLSLEHSVHSFLFCLRNILCWTTRTSRAPGPPGSSW